MLRKVTLSVSVSHVLEVLAGLRGRAKTWPSRTGATTINSGLHRCGHQDHIPAADGSAVDAVIEVAIIGCGDCQSCRAAAIPAQRSRDTSR